MRRLYRQLLYWLGKRPARLDLAWEVFNELTCDMENWPENTTYFEPRWIWALRERIEL